MNDFLTLAKKRFSARGYLEKPVENEKLNLVLEAARIAPTAANKQPVKIFVFTKGEKRYQINAVYDRSWMHSAPVLFVVCADHAQAWKHPKLDYDAGIIDVSIMVDHMTLAATDVGLATCWICNFDVQKCSEILNLDKNIEPVALLSMGYSEKTGNEKRHQSDRKSMNDIVIKME